MTLIRYSNYYPKVSSILKTPSGYSQAKNLNPSYVRVVPNLLHSFSQNI
jgi:peptide methionine sulfoxide reductase MsrA